MMAPKDVTINCRLNSQHGAALIIAVMVLLILTVIGIYAVTTSTLETKIAGSERVLQEAFQAADGGTDYGRRAIVLTLNNQSLPSGANLHPDPDYGTTLLQEIIGASGSNWENGSPWVEPAIGECDMEIHIDRIKAEETPGSSGEFGAPASEKHTVLYYVIDSKSTGIAGASSEIEATYRWLVQ